MTTDQEKVITKAAKLKAHMESAKKIGSLQEAEAFASMLQRMLAQHKLEMTDLEYVKMTDADPVSTHRIDYTKHKDVKLRKQRIQWIEDLASCVARAFLCRILVHDKSSRITLVGRKADCEMAEYMFVTMQRLVERISHNEWWKAHREKVKRGYTNEEAREELSGFRPAFIQSFVRRISERYDEERAKMRNENAGSTALVRLDMKPVDDFVAEKFTTTAKTLSTKIATHSEGWHRGRKVANDLNLTPNAMKTGTVAKQLSTEYPTMTLNLLTDTADIQWVLTTHLRAFTNLPTNVQSAFVVGNEDAPRMVLLYASLNPLVAEQPLARFEADAHGDLQPITGSATRMQRLRPGESDPRD